MAGVGQRLRLRLFIEGVEVPVIAATVAATPNTPAQCSIQIPPLPEGTRLFPRSLVHLFFLDFYEAASPFPTMGANNTSTNQSPTAYQQELEPDPSNTSQTQQTGDDPDLQNTKYKLLFGGEVVGFQWTKNQNNRSLVLQCSDWSNYWDYAYQFNNTDLFGPGVKAIFSGGLTNLFSDFLEEEGSAILRIIQTPSVQYPNLKGLLGGLVHLCESIGGTYFYAKKLAGENIFFTLAELRLHITQMITAYENDPTASRLIGGGYDSLFGRTLGGLGQQVSIRQAINALMAMIFHETYAQPCPSYTPGQLGAGKSSNTSALSVRADPDNAFIATTADNLIQSIHAQLQLLTATDVDPSIRALLPNSLKSMRTICNDTARQITAQPALKAKALYAAASRYLASAQGTANTWVHSPNSATVKSITSSLQQALKQMQLASNFIESFQAAPTAPARLNQQIFRPDVWFTAPPCSNVIFPEHYHTLTYSRSFLQEPTRLLLKTNDEFFGEDELFDQFYFAPKGFTLKSGGRELQDILSNDLLSHELFTGILPVFEKMGELNIFAARSGTVNGKVPKIGLAQRSCNFLYFKYRFAARQLQVQGKFNPYLAAGFPALVIDKYVNKQTLDLQKQLIAQAGGTTEESNELMGTHFLCNLTEVEHSVSQNSGQTNINCSYARQPEESVEFLGVIRADQTVQKRSNDDAKRVTIIAGITPGPFINGLGPNLGVITNVEDVTQAYQAKNATTGRQFPLYQGPQKAGTTQPSLSVPVGVNLPAAAYGQQVVDFIGSATQFIEFRAYRITELVPRYTKESVDLPAEEYIRPGWYGDCWAPSQIGQVYQQFFQTGSITDQQQADVGTNGANASLSSTAASQALQQARKAVDSDDPNASAPGILALDQGSSIQDAVNFIVQTYSYVKQNGLDCDDFIRSYTWRPIATMVDMFGTSDLVLATSADTGEVQCVQGIEGFHSRAFGPYNDIFGLLPPQLANLTNISNMQRGSAAAQKADVRGRRQLAVQKYVSALSFARAVIG